MNEHISILQGYIDHLEYMKKNAYELFDREQADRDIEAFKAAIKALEQEPCDDAISREDALMALTGEWTEITDEIIHRFIKRIKSLPPVTPQPNKEDIHREREQAYMCGFEDGSRKYRTEQSEDAISRQAAIDAMYALCNTGETLKENPWRDNPYIDAITDAIENLPSVNPQPKTGHWIKHDNGAWWECSKCHAERAYGNEYCPDCGSHNGDIAKMVEPQESEGTDADNQT